MGPQYVSLSDVLTMLGDLRTEVRDGFDTLRSELKEEMTRHERRHSEDTANRTQSRIAVGTIAAATSGVVTFLVELFTRKG